MVEQGTEWSRYNDFLSLGFSFVSAAASEISSLPNICTSTGRYGLRLSHDVVRLETDASEEKMCLIAAIYLVGSLLIRSVAQSSLRHPSE